MTVLHRQLSCTLAVSLCKTTHPTFVFASHHPTSSMQAHICHCMLLYKGFCSASQAPKSAACSHGNYLTVGWCCAHAPYTSCFCCLQAHRAIDSNVSMHLSLHDCLRGLGTVLKQLTGILLEEVPMLPGEPAITPRASLQSPQESVCNHPKGQPAIIPRVSLQSPQGSHCMFVTCSHVPVDLHVMGKQPCTGQTARLSLAAHPTFETMNNPVSLDATGKLESCAGASQ